MRTQSESPMPGASDDRSMIDYFSADLEYRNLLAVAAGGARCQASYSINGLYYFKFPLALKSSSASGNNPKIASP